jgi:hypothetical protein
MLGWYRKYSWVSLKYHLNNFIWTFLGIILGDTLIENLIANSHLCETKWLETVRGHELKYWYLSEIKPYYTSQVLRVLCTMFNAQGLKVIIIVVLVGNLKIYVTTIKAHQKYIWIYFTIEIDGFKIFTPCWMLMYFFARVFNLALHIIELKVQLLCFPYFMDNFIAYVFIFFKGLKSIFYLKFWLWFFYLKKN